MQAIDCTVRKAISVAMLLAVLFAVGAGFGCAGAVPGLVVNPSAVDLGSLNVGATGSPATVTLLNRGAVPVTISKASLSLPQVTLSGLTLPATLSPGQRVHVALTFRPNAAKSYSGTLALSTGFGRTVLARVFGTGIASSQTSPSGTTQGPLSLSSSIIAFGATAVGSTTSLAVTVSNTGGSNLSILGVSLSGPGFNATGLSSGLILAPGQSTVLTVTFSPDATGAVSGAVSISTDVAGTAVISLSGTGVNVKSVTLRWDPSPSSSISGYNIYRATTSGGEAGTSPINGSTPIAGDSYIDPDVLEGVTYYYEVVAVSAANDQSPDSNEAAVTIP